MKNLIIALIIGLAAMASGFMFIQNDRPTTEYASKLGNPKKDALKDIKNNELKLLTYGMPASFEHKKLKDSLNQQLGIRYESMAECVVSEQLINYVQTYNSIMKKQFAKKYGKNWERCIDLQTQMHQNKIYSQYSAEELANRYHTLDINFYFGKEESDIQVKDIVLIEANAIGFHQINGFKKQQYKIQLKAFHAKGQSTKVAKKRLQNIIDQLKAFGIVANNIEVLGIEESSLPNCESCSFNFQGYAQRVELKFEDN